MTKTPESTITTKMRRKTFLEQFLKRECVQFKASKESLKDPKDPPRCECGRKKDEHREKDEGPKGVAWNLQRSTRTFLTDAFGVIEFQGDPQHLMKAHFIRLDFKTDPQLIMQLMEEIWGLKRPKMVITIHGGFDDFPLQPKIARAFQKGLIKAAKTTGAWLITNGLNQGVVEHVSNALASARKYLGKNKIVTIGIAPWGLLRYADEFAKAGINSTVAYHPKANLVRHGRYSALNEMHSYFLLVDNGTYGRYGAEIILRRRFEEYLSQQPMAEAAAKELPVVSLVLEGGPVIIRQVLDYLTNVPPIPVVVCDQSGGAADILAFFNKHMTEAQNPYNPVFEKSAKAMITSKNGLNITNKTSVNYIYSQLKMCGHLSKYITAFRLGEDIQQDIDHAILSALLTRPCLNFLESLSLVSTWKRPDIARSDVFVRGTAWIGKDLDNAMMEALKNDRVGFVDVLLHNGCAMEKFLTIQRLEELYNTTKGPSKSNLPFFMKQLVKKTSQERYTLQDVGTVAEYLIGGAYVSPYKPKDFGKPDKSKKIVPVFSRPFNDLLIWAVLTMRQEMALCFWQRGEDALTKCQVAVKIYKACADKTSEYDQEQEVILRDYAREFEKKSVEYLGQCYQTDDDKTLQLLTYELKGWPDQTCLGLAILAKNRQFLSHTACQTLLADLWRGGMRLRKYGIFRVLFALLFPPLIYCLIEFKTKDELVLQAQKGSERNAIQKSMESSESKANRQLSCSEKYKEFFSAPITTFWIWTISYMTFLAVFGYVALKKTPIEQPSYAEYYLVMYAFTYGLEMIRRIIINEQRKLYPKIAQFCNDYWQLSSLLAIIILITAFILRQLDEDMVGTATVLYALTVGYFILRSLEIVGVSSSMGPYVSMIGSMLLNTIYMLPMFMVMLLCFGVLRQAIMVPLNDRWDWNLIRNLTLKPYMMWYGEVYADQVQAAEIDSCSDEENMNPCMPGSWIATLAYSAYLMLTNVILFNLLIAMFNYIYTETSAVSTQIWKFKRYHQVMEYEQHPFLPPPFVILYHIFVFGQFIRRCCCKKCIALTPSTDYALKLVLKEGDVEKLLDFEEECMEEWASQKDLNNYYSPNERLRRITDRQDFALMKLDDMIGNCDSSLATLGLSEEKMTEIEKIMKDKGGVKANNLSELSEPSIAIGATTRYVADGPRSGVGGLESVVASLRYSAGGSDSTMWQFNPKTLNLKGYKPYTTILDDMDTTAGTDNEGCLKSDEESL